MSRRNEGRLANVTGALWLGPDDGAVASPDEFDRLVTLLAWLFDEVLVVGDAPCGDARARVVVAEATPIAALCAVLEAASAERVLLVSQGCTRATAETLLALTAWPEHEVVLPSAADPAAPDCALLLRDAVLTRAREQHDLAAEGLGWLLARLDVSILADPDLVRLDPTK
ncbi:MAG: hypothetical protein JRG92_10260 [Deltaproteobacteria bacterium]|jgi:hypothetical protein|nr:hypothetical protein [Deltaproteobacteria bacterium]MBW2384010.1 hypothetical protein [Deltaproteobacteria bacterium]MBW2696133.1 hypothetical protein [Deltaproteobacteria bacterium]